MTNEKNKPLISIIVPIYNTEEYIKESLDALVNQTLQNIQIICVNDASTDGSLAILEEYAENDDRFVIINNTTNSGPSICRNIALEHVTGEYVTFFDSDDIIDLDAYEKVYDFAKTYNQDFVVFNAVRLNENGNLIPSVLHEHSIPEKTIPKTNILQHPSFVYDTTLWNKVIKSEFLNKHQFKFAEGRVYQDILFTMQMFCASDCVGILPDVTYYWRRRGNENLSITQQPFNTKNLKDRIFINKNTLEVIKSDDKYLELLDPFYVKLIEIDLIKFINQLDLCDDEFKELLFGRIKSFVESLPEHIYDNVLQEDMIKVDLYLNGNYDSLIELAKVQRFIKLQRKELRSKNRDLRNKNKELKTKNKQLKTDIQDLKSQNQQLQTDLDYLKSVSGWTKYKLKHIF